MAKLKRLDRREKTVDCKRLMNMSTSSIRSLGAKSRTSSGRSSRGRIINGIDPKSLEQKVRLAGFKFRSRVFRMTESVMDVYRKNMNLQKKLDHIKTRGTGISNVRPIKPPAIPGDSLGFTSLNFFACKAEADRINYENMRMASRLMTSQSQLRPLTDRAVKAQRRAAASRKSPPSGKGKYYNCAEMTEKYSKLEKRHKSRVANAFGHFTN